MTEKLTKDPEKDKDSEVNELLDKLNHAETEISILNARVSNLVRLETKYKKEISIYENRTSRIKSILESVQRTKYPELEELKPKNIREFQNLNTTESKPPKLKKNYLLLKCIYEELTK